MNKWLVFCIAILCCISSSLAYPFGQTYDSVLLQDVKALTFTKGQYTAARRSAPIPQLNCVGGGASYSTELYPSTVQCVNVGVDSYGNVQWKCEADLDSSVKFGETTVNCEGYSNPDDPYILRGSCGLEYSLEYTPQGMKSRNGGSYGSQSNYNYNHNYYPESNRSFSWGNVFMFVIFGIIVIGIINQCSKNAATSNNNFYEGTYPSTTYSNGYGYGNTGTWRPGFWSGFGSGGLLGYLFRPRTYYGAPPPYSYNRPTYNSWGSSGGSFGSSGGSFGSSSGPRTASAFASTRKR